jgi:hypothetical protein
MPVVAAAAAFGACDAGLLLRPPDVLHTLVSIELPQVWPRRLDRSHLIPKLQLPGTHHYHSSV